MVILTTFPAPEEGIRHCQNNTAAHVQKNGKPGKSLGRGTLYIAESSLSWSSSDGPGFTLEYPAISLHAISKDTTAFPEECLYIMVDADLRSEGEDNDGSSSDEEDTDPITEFRFIPDDKTALENMYSAMCDCQALHPDEEQDSLPDGAGDDAEEDDDYYEGENGAENLTENGQATLARLEAALISGSGDQARQPPLRTATTSDPAIDEPQIGNIANGQAEPMDADDGTMETGQFDDAEM